MRIAITGAPGTGKTTLAQRLSAESGVTALHSDDLIHLGWSEASQAASEWFDMVGPLLVEGVAIPRALRKWMLRNPVGKPIDELIICTTQWHPLNGGRAAMGKSIYTVLKEISPELSRRGVRIVEG